ncbi:hypothetical protein BWQ96_10742 [Gracilariopsis chorda]|uniref:Uncharacterized protein n=1 Tax=Gracilariopsis chorda TaxID=448386 RepID=A0A2V3IBT3_9FLOR|nr:hypothetical protein BWQ96_10742 [Gracilariopsis chorda]|eukprot:PXF39559.1 hypothetical protein BWQ96_10742 [Gracilariopsis chorda]
MDAVSFEEFKSVHDLPHEYDAATPQHNLRRRSTEAVTPRSVGDMKLRIRPQLRKKSSRKKLSKMSNLCFWSTKGLTSDTTDLVLEEHQTVNGSNGGDVLLDHHDDDEFISAVAESEAISLYAELKGTYLLERSYESRWYEQLRHLEKCHPKLFELLEVRDAGPGTFYFKGIGATVKNCLGLRRVYETYYKPRLQNNGKGAAAFTHLSTTVSQFLRWAICTSTCSRKDVWKEHVLFRALADQKVVNRFIEMLMLRSSPGTVKNRITSMKRVCDVGVIISGDTAIGMRLKLVLIVLQHMENASRCAYRKRCQAKKDLINRSVPRHLDLIKRRALGALNFTMRSFWHRKQRSGTDAARKSMRSYLQIWNMNFMGLIMLVSGGQRPQVFSGLQLPNEEEFQQLTFQAEQSSYIELRTGTEKRPRYIDLPFMILPVTVMPYLTFHVKYMRPEIQEAAGRSDEGLFEPLFIDSKTALGFKPSQVTRRLQLFLSSHGIERGCVTSMDLRRDYATRMLRNYRQKCIFSNLTENAFLEKLAQQMNTSVEQLKRTYVAHSSKIISETAEVVKYWGAVLDS